MQSRLTRMAVPCKTSRSVRAAKPRAPKRNSSSSFRIALQLISPTAFFFCFKFLKNVLPIFTSLRDWMMRTAFYLVISLLIPRHGQNWRGEPSFKRKTNKLNKQQQTRAQVSHPSLAIIYGQIISTLFYFQVVFFDGRKMSKSIWRM